MIGSDKKHITNMSLKGDGNLLQAGHNINIHNHYTLHKGTFKEVKTIMRLLEFLSSDDHYQESDVEYKCDPEKKVKAVFKNAAENFYEDYNELFEIYKNPMIYAKEAAELDTIKSKKISYFLSRISNEHLEKSNNDAVKAIDSLKQYLGKEMEKLDEKVDYCAINYFLLEELIGCNVFSQLGD